MGTRRWQPVARPRGHGAGTEDPARREVHPWATTGSPPNRDVLRAIGVHQHLTMAFTGAGCLVAVVVALLWEVAGLGGIDLVLALRGTLLIVATLARSVPYRNRVTGYAGVRPDAGRRR